MLRTWRSYTHLKLKGKPSNNFLATLLHVCLSHLRKTIDVQGHPTQGQREVTLNHFKCLLCAYRTPTRNVIRRHISDVHKKTERVNCNICGGSFKHIHSLKSHQIKCRRKHGNSCSQNNSLFMLKSVNEEKVSRDGEDRDAYISDSDPKTIKKENARGDGDAEDSGQIDSDSDPLSLLRSLKQKTVSNEIWNEDDGTAPVEGEYKVCDTHQDAEGLGCSVEDAFGLD